VGLAEDTSYVGSLLDAYGTGAWKMHVASEDPEDAGVPPSMQVGEVNEDGWVEWRLLPSTLTEVDVAEVEREFGIVFPPLFRAYLLARFQLFDQAKSKRYDQQILMTDTPENRPLVPLRELLSAWRPLIDADYVPFAQWGDGWGPMCFDARARGSDGDCPVVWIDHERVIPLGEDACRRREVVEPLAQLLYGSCREFLHDVFGGPAAA
jgi:hypothetical protein